MGGSEALRCHSLPSVRSARPGAGRLAPPLRAPGRLVRVACGRGPGEEAQGKRPRGARVSSGAHERDREQRHRLGGKQQSDTPPARTEGLCNPNPNPSSVRRRIGLGLGSQKPIVKLGLGSTELGRKQQPAQIKYCQAARHSARRGPDRPS